MELVNGRGLAARLGVTESAIGKARRAGRISYADDARKLYDPVAAEAQWWTHRRRVRAPSQGGAEKSDARPRVVSDGAALLSAKLRRELADAERAELGVKQMRGELCLVADAVAAFFTHSRMARDRLRAMPSRLAPTITAMTDVGEVGRALDAEVDAVCSGIAKAAALFEHGVVRGHELAALALRGDQAAAIELGLAMARIIAADHPEANTHLRKDENK